MNIQDACLRYCSYYGEIMVFYVVKVYYDALAFFQKNLAPKQSFFSRYSS